MVCGIISMMEDTAQAPESQAALPQKPSKPTNIKILQWVYLAFGLLALFLTGAEGPNFVPFLSRQVVFLFFGLQLAIIGLSFLVYTKQSLKIALWTSVVSTVIYIFPFIYFFFQTLNSRPSYDRSDLGAAVLIRIVYSVFLIPLIFLNVSALFLARKNLKTVGLT